MTRRTPSPAPFRDYDATTLRNPPPSLMACAAIHGSMLPFLALRALDQALSATRDSRFRDCRGP